MILRESLKNGIMEWVKKLITINTKYSDKPIGRQLATIDIPIIRGYIIIEIYFSNAIIFQGYIAL